MLDLQKRINKITKADEPTKVSNFDGKKADELKRLQKMIVSYDTTACACKTHSIFETRGFPSAYFAIVYLNTVSEWSAYTYLCVCILVHLMLL